MSGTHSKVVPNLRKSPCFEMPLGWGQDSPLTNWCWEIPKHVRYNTFPITTFRRRNFGYPGNREGIKGRTKSSRPSYSSAGWSKHTPNHRGHTGTFRQRNTGTEEAPLYVGSRAETNSYGNEKAMGGAEEEEGDVGETIALHQGNILIRKGYVQSWLQREKAEPNVIDCLFTSNPEKAARWTTKEEAEAECALLDRFSIEIPSAEGGKYVCKGFRAEEWKPNEFVIFCLAPFISNQMSA